MSRNFHFCLLIALLFQFRENPCNASNQLDQIRQAIAQKKVHWTAGENWVTRLSADEQKKLCGALMQPADPSQARLLTLPPADSLPPVFDWRDNNGNWVTPVKRQGGCGSCWDFAAVAQVESWWKIHNACPDSMIDLSEQFVLSCSDGGCDGWAIEGAFEFIRSVGIPPESCFEYQVADSIPCSEACEDWQDDAITIPSWGFVTLQNDDVNTIKNALWRHPVSARFNVYQDFSYYSDGVYEHVWGDYVGGHYILITGWNDDEQSWISKNSWRETWGQAGYFHIKWSECGIGQHIPFIWEGVIGDSALAVSPHKIDLSLKAGEEAFESITIINSADGLLEFSVNDCELLTSSYFHPDRFNAWEGLSLWCSDVRLQGYDNEWLQYLETPAMNLTNTTHPKLTWMGYWALEDTAAMIPFDGWDGCNLWVSIDNGRSFRVATPSTPPYNCQNLYSFYKHSVKGWNLGTDIAGWGGKSQGWTPVEFDLSAFKADSVIIRFAFASDPGVCTADDSSLYGLFIDDILVFDDAGILFENHGDAVSPMKPWSYAAGDQLGWLSVPSGMGTIAPGDSENVTVRVPTANLEPDDYIGILSISSNDTTWFISETVQVNLHVLARDHDLAVSEINIPAKNTPLFVPTDIGAHVKNIGLNDEADFDVLCTIDNDQCVIADTVRISMLKSGESTVIHFKPFGAAEPEDYHVTVTTLFPFDENTSNNIAHSLFQASNLVDDFELESGFWDYSGGWGRTQDMAGYSSQYAAHVNNGITPYSNNMDATMTLKPGFDLRSARNATLTFWTRYYTELNKDVCYIEASADSLTWCKLDSFSGTHPQWIKHEVGLTDFIRSDSSRTWIRFHFISDSATVKSIGVVIDSVAIFNRAPTVVRTGEPTAGVPHDWNLTQNYPNPFNPATTFEYALPTAGHVQIVIYDVLGRNVKTLVDTQHSAGRFHTAWDGTDENNLPVAAGVYFCRMQAEEPSSSSEQRFIKVIKLALVK